MLEVLIPTNSEYKKYEQQARELYESCQNKICDPNSFDFIQKNTLLYLFLSDKKFIGLIYYFFDAEKLFLNACSVRKSLEDNLRALKLSTTWFKSDIYAEAQNRASAFCLLRCGFKRVKDNLFCYKKEN